MFARACVCVCVVRMVGCRSRAVIIDNTQEREKERDTGQGRETEGDWHREGTELHGWRLAVDAVPCICSMRQRYTVPLRANPPVAQLILRPAEASHFEMTIGTRSPSAAPTSGASK